MPGEPSDTDDFPLTGRAEALVMDPQPGPKGPQPSAAMFAATSDHEAPSSRLEQENVDMTPKKSYIWSSVLDMTGHKMS